MNFSEVGALETIQRIKYDLSKNALNSEYITDKLITYISNINVESSLSISDKLFPIALCIRYGADVNTYIDDTSISKYYIHILAYYHKKINNINVDVPLISILDLLLVASGSNPLFPVIKRQEEGLGKSSNQIVRDYLNKNGFINSLSNLNTFDLSNVDDRLLTEISILLDRPDLSLNLQDNDSYRCIRYYATNVFKKFISLQNIESLAYECVRRANDECLYILLGIIGDLTTVYIPDYLFFNFIIQNLEKSISEVKDNYIRIVRGVVQVGYKPDIYQIKLLKEKSPESVEEVNILSQEPYWKRYIVNKSLFILPNELQVIKDFLSIPINLLINTIEGLYIKDRDLVRQTFIEKRIKSISDKFSTILEILDDKLLICNNRNISYTDPYLYIDIDLVSYRDEKSNLWCFTKDLFNTLLEKSENIYTNEILPKEVIEEIKIKNINSIMISIDDILNKIYDGWNYNNYIDEWEKKVSSIKSIKKLIYSQQVTLLSKLDKNVSLVGLTPELRYSTLLYILKDLNKSIYLNIIDNITGIEKIYL